MYPEPEHIANRALTGDAAPAGAIADDPFLRALVQHTGDGIIVKDLEGRILLVSERVTAFFGLTAAQLVGRLDTELFPPEAAARERELDRQVIASGQPVRAEALIELWRLGDPAAGTAFISVTKFPFFTPDGELAAIVGVGRDVTIYNRLEAQLAEAEGIAGLGSWTYEVATETCAWSASLYRLYGFEPGGVRAGFETLARLVGPAEGERLAQVFARALKEQETFESEYAVTRGDGVVRRMQGRARVLRAPDGRAYRMIGTVQDVTEALAMQQDAARGHALLRALMDTSEEGMLVVDERQAIISHNRRFRELFGVSEALLAAGEFGPVLAQVDCQVVDPEAFRARVRAQLAQPLASGREEVRLRDGRMIERFTTPLVALGPVSHGRVCFFRDITASKALEEALRAQNERLHELGELKSTFVNALSHDLRTPLTAVVGYAEFLEDGQGGELSQVQSGYVAEIVRNAKRLEGMVDDLLDVARLEAGVFEIRRCESDVVDLAEGTIAAFLPQADARGIGLVLETGTRPAAAQVDAARLERVFANLIGNALKFTPRGGQVRVRVGLDDARVRAEVVDTGPGIAPEDVPRLFQRFSQLGDRQGGGTGLGLFISRTIVEAHGGAIGVDSVPGEGATFWLELPPDEERAP